ncbi:hypothetical protein EV182_006585 [Spiromyces aspiralis]|uniref:Uncharacterized protein n=1 Tax=Spiromyces aspiralis TaxID=68401 RepID=A0ACC1HM16_9FUNG|nr:hypothetical protein EV182_006585 [Spiromyces aspiralis]
MEERYRERERCWMDLEKDRIEQIQRLDLRELVEMENRVKDQDIMAKRLAEWDDKREEARGRELYYRNREKWWRQRRAERARELKRDEEDLQEEEAEKRVSTVEATTDATTTTTTTEPEGEDKLPSQQQQPWQGENDVKAGEELEPIAKEAKVPKPALPESRDDLFGWPVKWNNLSDQVLSNKIRPVAEHWLRQHFGDATEEEDLNDLVQSVTEHLQAHKSAQGLVDDLDMLLDESTGTFVELVWRTLVSETESFAEDSTPS